MASDATIDFSLLLAPIPGEKPAGESVRYSGEYDAIQDARRSDDDLPMGDWQREVKIADWGSVLKLSTAVLETKSKDLQIGVWLVEALVKQHGFGGLRDGCRLLRELQESFWEVMYPEAEDGDLEFRAGPLQWLNEKLPVTIKDVSLTDGDVPYSWRHWEESRMVDNLGRQNPDAMAAAMAEGKITGEQFDKVVSATPRARYETLLEDLTQAQSECQQLIDVIDEKFAGHAPSLLGFRKSIEDCRTLVEGIVKEKRRVDPSYRAEEPSTSGLDTVNADLPVNVVAGGGLSREPASREDAFQRLAVIAEYLKRKEPQNPVSYLVERAVRWSKMPLEQWLGEVVQNDEVLFRLRDTLGIKRQEET